MKKIKIFLAALLVMMTALSASINTFADESSEESYKPLDVVIVFDISGSMNKSDKDHLVPDAIRMFVNMLPAGDSRLGIVSFNEEARTLTTSNDKPAFLATQDIKNVDSVHDLMDQIEYSGDTAIGNGLKNAVDLFQSDGREDANKAIIVFSDGVDDLKSTRKRQAAQDNLTDAVQWAASNNCPIYTLGFNYKSGDGKDSISGEGLDKLNYISSTTHASSKEINTLKEIEQNYVDILSQICEVIYRKIDEIPGDGGHHEIPIDVTDGVVEMNIRIACNTENALSDGSIELQNPKGENISLENRDSVRTDMEKRSANIKVLRPESGEYTLVLDGIKGEDVTVGLLNHYEIGIKCDLALPDGNPDGTAYAGDTVGINVELLNADGENASESLYKEISEADAVIRSRSDGEEQNVSLSYTDGALKGSFTFDGKGVSDITATVVSPNFRKTASAVLTNGNHPVELTGTGLENQKLNVKKQVTISNIYSAVTDPEGDAVRAEIANLSNPDVADVTIDGNNIVIDGRKWGSTIVTVKYTDAQNNEVETTFSVKVSDPLKMMLISLIPILIGAIVLAFVLYLASRLRKVSGVFDVGPVNIAYDGQKVTIGRPLRLNASSACRGTKTNLYRFMKKYAEAACSKDTTTDEQYEVLQEIFVQPHDRSVRNGLSTATITGTFRGKRGFVLQIPKGSPVIFEGRKDGGRVKEKIQGTREFTLSFKGTGGTEIRVKIIYYQTKPGQSGLGDIL